MMSSDAVGFVEAPYGSFHIWDHPIDGRQYIVGADVALGKIKDLSALRRDPQAIGNLMSSGNRPDYSAAMVVDLVTGQHVASWHGYVDPPEYAGVLAAIGFYYHTAQLVVESNSFGYSVVETLMNFIRYPNLYVNKLWNKTNDELTGSQVGWVTTNQSRPLLISRIHEWLAAGCTTRDLELVKEFEKMQFDEQGVPRARGTDKDDRVLALGMALQGRYESLYGYEGSQSLKQEDRLPHEDRQVWNWVKSQEKNRIGKRNGGVRIRPLPRPRRW